MIRLGLALYAIVLMTCETNPAAVRPAALRVISPQTSAEVFVEGRFVGLASTLSQRPASIRPGVHHITITAHGYFPHDLEQSLPSGETTIRISLRPIPP
jgi:hypothetical protein